MNKRKPRNYVNNRDLYEHMKVYHKAYWDAKKAGQPLPRLPPYIGTCILQIAQNLAKKKNFSRYSYVEEMISDAVENCVMYIHNFDPNISKVPFAYISMVSRRAFIRRILMEKRSQYTMLANSQRYMIEDQLNPSQIMGETVELYDNLVDFMKEFEEKNNVVPRKKKDIRRPKEVEIVEFWA